MHNNKPFPYISILIPVRNESGHIIDCLKALTSLSYPKSQLEVHIGNDGSTDDTEKKIRNFITDKPYFFLQNINHNIGYACARANVLAHLCKKAKGDIFLILDANVQAPINWVGEMIKHAGEENYDMVTGFTAIIPKGFWACLQAIEWCTALGVMKCASDFGYPLTAMGNNMLITKKTYQQTGGYEKISFSITEDYALFRVARKKGSTHKQLLSLKAICYRNHNYNISNFLHQRKRWLRGASEASWFIRLIFIIYAAIPPLLILLLFWNTVTFLWVYGFMLLSQNLFSAYFLFRSGQKKLLPYLLIFEPYRLLVYLSVFIFYLLPIRINWKGRIYI